MSTIEKVLYFLKILEFFAVHTTKGFFHQCPTIFVFKWHQLDKNLKV